MSTQGQLIQKQRGGKKAKKYKKNKVLENPNDVTLKEDGQEYARIDKLLGGGHYTVFCFDGITRIAHKRGAMKRGHNRANIGTGDLVLIAKREYQDSKCDIIQKYSDQHIQYLLSKQELPINYTNPDKTNIDNLIATDQDMPFDFKDI